MAFTQVLYLPENLKERLKKEKNISKLISDLLYKHYESKGINNDIESEILRFQKEKENLLEEFNRKENELLYKKEIIEKQVQEEEETESKKQEREDKFIEVIIKNAKELFNADITESDVKIYRQGEYNNLLEFLIQKGYVKQGEF
jgi:hypothetical protein